MTIFAVLVALEVAAVVLAVRAGWCRPNNRLSGGNSPDGPTPPKRDSDQGAWGRVLLSPIVVVLVYALADELAVEALHRWLFYGEHPVRAAIERHGWPARLAYHVEVAIVLGWSALLAAAAWSAFADGNVTGAVDCHGGGKMSQGTTLPVFAPQVRGQKAKTSVRARELLFGSWLIAAGGMAACYPLPRGWTAPILHGVELLFVACALAAIPAGWRSRAIVTREGKALGIVLVTELAVAVLGAWGSGSAVFTSWDELARVPYAIGWGVLCVVLIRGRRHEDPAPPGAAQDRRS